MLKHIFNQIIFYHIYNYNCAGKIGQDLVEWICLEFGEFFDFVGFLMEVWIYGWSNVIKDSVVSKIQCSRNKGPARPAWVFQMTPAKPGSIKLVFSRMRWKLWNINFLRRVMHAMLNWYFSMEPSRKIWVYSHGATPEDALESVATHSLRLQPSIICIPQLQPSAALVPKFMTMRSEMKAEISFETTIEPHDLVYHLWLAHHGQKPRILLLDHCFVS